MAALLVTRWKTGPDGLRAFVRGIGSAHAAGVALVWGILFPAAAFVTSAVILGLVTRAPVVWNRLGVAHEYPALGPIQYVVTSLVFYGFGEEVGWRGFLYPALRRRLSALGAALLVVPFWAVWHLPLFFVTESYRAMGVGSAVGWLLSLASGGILTAWLYERARGSRSCPLPSSTPRWTSSSSLTWASQSRRCWARL